MKHLPKHLRPRWRYLAVELEAWPDARLGRGAFQGRLYGAARSLLGDPGSAGADLRVVRFRADGGDAEAVVRARRGHVDGARAALACVDAVDGDPVRVTVRGVSGTVRACEEKYMGGDPEAGTEEQVVFDGTERRAVVRDGAVDVRADGGFVGATEFDLE